MRDELLELWRELDQRRVARERRGGFHAGWRCWGCHKFLAGPTVTCPWCGQRHGGIFHDAYACR